jgi:hypothetical protein
VVDPFAFLTAMIPRDNAIVRGLTDGALAARAAVFKPAHGAEEHSGAAATLGAAAQPA